MKEEGGEREREVIREEGQLRGEGTKGKKEDEQ